MKAASDHIILLTNCTAGFVQRKGYFKLDLKQNLNSQVILLQGCEMVMGHLVDDELLKMVQLSLEDIRKEFAAVQEAVTSFQGQQQSLEDKVEEQKQRLDEMSAQHSEQGENYNRILEIMESLKTQRRQGTYAVTVSSVKLFTSLSLPFRNEKRSFLSKQSHLKNVFFVSPNPLNSVLRLVLTFT